MQLYSTNNKNNTVNLKEAVMNSLPSDKGLYMPTELPSFTPTEINELFQLPFDELSLKVAQKMIGSGISAKDLKEIVYESINFPAPVRMFNDQIGVLELFHGPSMAFKDFGARFMSRIMSTFNQNEDRPLTILVATSGDTGGAVAAGFYNTPGIEVIILYPKDKVSELQEKQLTTLGKNIYACEINGTFDDCQSMVKEAFLDQDLKDDYRLSSANSINIARLIPQTFYYFEAYKQINEVSSKIVFSIPSGNFGNLTAGLMAKKMGLPIHHFIAATNINKIVPEYLDTGVFNPRPSKATISNAMDVGNPSNFARLKKLYNDDLKAIQSDITGYFYTDEETAEGIKIIRDKYDYIADPHGAIGYLALQSFLSDKQKTKGIFLETAHPGKFLPTVEHILEETVTIPSTLSDLYDRKKKAESLNNEYKEFKDFLLGRK